MNEACRLVYVVGGDVRLVDGFPDGLEVRHFGSSRSEGNGSLRRLLASIRSGAVDLVLLLVRWLGHAMAEEVRAACRAARVRVLSIPGGRSSAVRVARDFLAGVSDVG